MRRMTCFIMAAALVLGMAQCKKDQPQSQAKTVYITLEVEGDNSNAKINVNPAYGTVEFEDGDQILVGYDGAYVGTLTHNGTNFTGSITLAQNGQKPLYFYFLGNKPLMYHNTTNDQWETYTDQPTCSVHIGDQTSGKLPVISMGPSNEYYIETSTPSTPTTYTAHLRNQCALVKFDLTTSSTAPTCITGFNNVVTVDFANNTVVPSMEGEGEIRLPANTTSGEHWAILLPQAAVGEKMAFSEDGLCYGTQGSVPAIVENGYLPNGIAVTLDQTRSLIDGAVNGLFTINNSGKQVRFSMGNLQYIGSAGNGDDNNTGAYWQFAPLQWEILGVMTGQNSDSKTVDRDLFSWGTSGWNSGNTYYRPWDTYTIGNDVNQMYGPPQYENLTGNYANADWGVYNAIRNGGNLAGQWRTLTRAEWAWVLGPRAYPNPGTNCRSGIRFAMATVNGVNGLIILPDGWSESTYALNATNTYNAAFTTNEISGTDWMDKFEPQGAVFLPAAGSRSGTPVYVRGAGIIGVYWSAKYYKEKLAHCLYFYSGYFEPESSNPRCVGYPVRLVRNVN